MQHENSMFLSTPWHQHYTPCTKLYIWVLYGDKRTLFTYLNKIDPKHKRTSKLLQLSILSILKYNKRKVDKEYWKWLTRLMPVRSRKVLSKLFITLKSYRVRFWRFIKIKKATVWFMNSEIVIDEESQTEYLLYQFRT